jgi:hypothetical protein
MRDRKRLPEFAKPEHRLSFEKFVDKAFWLLLVLIANSIASKVTRIDRNISELNEKLAVAVTKASSETEHAKAVEKRVEVLERLHFAQRK